MKNTIKLFGIIALVAVIGFAMAACGGDDSPSNGPSDVPDPVDKPDTESQITFTDLGAPFVVDVYVAGEASTIDRYWAFGASEPVADVITGAKLSGNSITLNVYELDYDSGVFSLFTGTATIDGEDLSLYKLTGTTYDTAAGAGFDDRWITKAGKTVTFTNGTATVSFDDMEEY